jgi:hypothetical protein
MHVILSVELGRSRCRCPACFLFSEAKAKLLCAALSVQMDVPTRKIGCLDHRPADLSQTVRQGRLGLTVFAEHHEAAVENAQAYGDVYPRRIS